MSGPIIENVLIEWRRWLNDLEIGKIDVTDSYEGVYCILAFEFVDQNRWYNHSNETFLASLLEEKGITHLKYFSEWKLGFS